jgi:alpha-L-fucosidase
MRFGMFIHWGPVSLTGHEIGWSRGRETPQEEYDNLYKRFNPAKFDAAEWVSIAKAAGMRYIVLTSKHHDGFCLWDASNTDYDIMSSPFKRDVMKELSNECKRQGVRFGPYYSICDWYQPDYGLSHKGGPGYKLDREPDLDTYISYMKHQLKELNTRYGPFHVFWFDGEWEKPWTHEHGVDLNNFCRRLQPDVLINNRVDKGRRGMEGMSKPGEFAGDYGTPEQQIGAFDRRVPWETCMTICRQWAWKPDDEMKSLKECLHALIYSAGGDGNLLFNVGPMPDGRIEPRQVERLKEMGQWLAKYGESIYGTRGGPFKPGQWGASTCNDDRIYLHVMNWPDADLRLPAIGRKIKGYRVLTGGEATVKQSSSGISVSMAERERQAIATVIVLTIDGPAFEVEPFDVETPPKQ